MADRITDADRAWAAEQVREYTALYPRYVLYAATLQALLDRVARTLAADSLVQARPKAIVSFAEAIWRKRDRAPDPVHDFTDLAGGRIITMTRDEARAVCAFIEANFEIDWEHTICVGQRLGPTGSGFRSVSYVVQIPPGRFPSEEVPVSIPEEVLGLKAEIQVRTMLEHVWADVGHQSCRQGDAVPETWRREFAALAAVLEESDARLSRLRESLRLYASRSGPYGERDRALQRIEILATVLRYDRTGTALADEIGRLCIAIGDRDRAIATLEPFASSGDPHVLRDLGTALTQAHPPGSAEYARGQQLLEDAIGRQPRDAEAIATLAGTWRGIDEERARRLSGQAFDANPTNPFALSTYLDDVVAEYGDLSPVRMLRPTIAASIRRCRELARLSPDLPWPHYTIARFLLLLGDPYGSLAAVARAVDLTHDARMIRTQLRSLTMLGRARKQVKGLSWVESVLTLALAAKFRDERAMAESAAMGVGGLLLPPVAIVAGGTDAAVEERIEEYRGLLLAGFEGYAGTIISGGTRAGISALVGDVQEVSGEAVRTVGYLPTFIRSDEQRDERYAGFRPTGGTGFSPLEPIRYWADLIASGVPPSSVRLIGINGGKISAAEYRVALALGAEVGIIQGSGRAASQLLVDEDWCRHPRLVPLPPDPSTLRAFFGSWEPLDPATRLRLGRRIHEEYLAAQAGEAKRRTPSLRDWEHLPAELRESSLQQADHVAEKLRAIGCTIRPAADRAAARFSFTDDEVERLAEIEHGRWNAERLRDGWRIGAASFEGKMSPYLVPWSELPDEVRELDRAAVRRIPDFLGHVGLEVRRGDDTGGGGA